MEDGDAAQRTTGPFGVVFLKLGVHGLEEGADEGHLEEGTLNRALVHDVGDWAHWVSTNKSRIVTGRACEAQSEVGSLNDIL